ncbi:unnamed protein product [Cuscuta campestris]|uniref:Uncharacterized protein n=1 Tax=Cuscuta campestris TaxID=132261 RepID=A0A484M9B1_9ASTE|nr:unnamed protein product [Cuscuta campestris]
MINPCFNKTVDGSDAKIQKSFEEYSKEEAATAECNDKALNALFRAVDSSQYRLIANCTEAQKAWKILETTHEGDERVKTAKYQILMTKFENLRMEDNESITEFHGRVRDLANEAERLGRPFEEDNLVLKVLHAQPESYSVDAKAIRQAHDLKRMMLDQLMGNLETIELAMSEEQKKKKTEKQIAFQICEQTVEKLQQELNQKETENANLRHELDHHVKYQKTGLGYPKGESSKTPLDLFIKRSDIREEIDSLPVKKDVQQNQERKTEKPRVKQIWVQKHVASHANSCMRVTPEQWLLDSGCSHHMTGDNKSLKNMQEIEGGSVRFGGGAHGQIIGCGILNVTGLPSIKNVWLVEGLQVNLLSISQICDQGLEVTFTQQKCRVKDKNKLVVLEGDITTDNCYRVSPNKLVVLEGDRTTASEKDARLWHYRLGHINYKDLATLSNLGAVRETMVNANGAEGRSLLVSERECRTPAVERRRRRCTLQKNRRHKAPFGDSLFPANMAGQRPPDPSHHPPDVPAFPSSHHTPETTTGNVPGAAAIVAALPPFFLASTGPGDDPLSSQVLPLPQTTPSHPFAASSGAGMGCTSAAAMAGLPVGSPPPSLFPGQYSIAQLPHVPLPVFTSAASHAPSILVTGSSGFSSGEPHTALMASQLPNSFSPAVPLSQAVTFGPYTPMMVSQQTLNVEGSKNMLVAPMAHNSTCAPGVCGNVSMTFPTPSPDFLKVKVPINSLNYFNWQDIPGAVLKGLVDSEHVIMHVPVPSNRVMVAELQGPRQWERNQPGLPTGMPLMGLPLHEAGYGSSYCSNVHACTSCSSTARGEKGVTFAPHSTAPMERQGVLSQKLDAITSKSATAVATPRQEGPHGIPKSSFAQVVAGPSMAGTSKSFAQALTGSTNPGISLRATASRPSAILPNVVVEDKNPTFHRGTPGVVFKKSEMQRLSQLDNFLLIGKFSHGRPEIATLRKFFAEKFLLRESVQISLRDPRHVMLLFTHPLDCNDIFMQGQIQFNGQFPMRLFRWSPEFNVKTESFVAPVWVTFPNLRADLFNESAIHQLCKPIGRCLKVDVATSTFSRPNVAKARVEIDLLKPRIEQFWIGFSDEPGEEDVGMFQSVEYERIPKYCTACYKQGHDNSSCNTLTPSQPDQRAVVVVPQPSMPAPTNTQPPRRRRSRSRVRRQREGKGIAIVDAGTSAGGSQREESQYVWREKTAKGSRPIEVVDTDDVGKGEGPSLQAFVPTSSHPSPNVVIPDACLVPSTVVNATPPTSVVVEQSASQALEPSVPPTGVEQGPVVASLPLSTSSSSIVHVPDPQLPELALAMSNTFDALGEMPGDSHEDCDFNTAASSIPSDSVRKEDDDCSSQTSDGSMGDHFEDPTDIARDLAASGVSPAREAPTTRDPIVARFTQPRDAPHIHHLAYADDIFIFTSSRGDTLERVQAVLRSYEQISGQAVSLPKSAFYMHPKALAPVLERVRDTLGCSLDVLPFTYLGCPIYHGRKRIHYFEPILKKMRDKCCAWMGRYLSPGGKAIMIKSVLQAIPTHLLAAHFPPKAVIREMESIMARFFWSSLGGTRRYHWGSWKTLARHTREGGVGFLDFMTLAKSCSAKLRWNFRTQDTIWTAFMRAKYCSRVHPVSKQRVNDDSHTWKRMLDVRAVVEPVIRWRVLSGTSNFWWDTCKTVIPQKFNHPSVSKHQPSWFKKYCQVSKKLRETKEEKEAVANQGSSASITHMQQQEDDAAHPPTSDLPQVLCIEYHKSEKEAEIAEVQKPDSAPTINVQSKSSPDAPVQENEEFIQILNVHKKSIIVQRRIDVEDFKLKTNLIPLLEKSKLLKSVTLQGSFVKSVICEFYCNLSESCADPTDPMFHKVFLRGKTYKLSPALINTVIDLTPSKKDTKISEKTMWLDLTNGQRASQSSKAKISSSILKSSYAILLRVAALHWLPTTHTNTVSKIMARLLYKIKHNIPFDLGKLIFDQIMLFAAEKYKANSIGLPYPTLLYSLLVSQGSAKKKRRRKNYKSHHSKWTAGTWRESITMTWRLLVKEELARTSQLKEKLEIEKGHLVVLLHQAREATPDEEHTDSEEDIIGSTHSDEQESHTEGESEEGDSA